MSLAEGAKEAIYLQSFLTELGFKDIARMIIYNDNSEAKMLAVNPVFYDRSKHIDIKYYFVWEAVKNQQLKIQHISTSDMTTDIFTKALPGPNIRSAEYC